MKKILSLIVMMSMVGCSNIKSMIGMSNDVAEDTQEITDFVDDAEIAESIEAVEGLDLEEEFINDAMADVETNDVVDEVIQQNVSLIEDASIEIDETLAQAGELQDYIVGENETLMMIAFKIYGDYAKWKEIAALNGVRDIKKGDVIKFNAPAEAFVWRPDGLPYIIQKNDTLGTISYDKYGTNKKWRAIWDNNKPLIKDPDLIFAGFTLYYVPEEDRALASEY